ncbi:MAG: phytanoyl-CoA dioxygenase family protein [Candidatus Poribacteria bacterium]|nr:phytanoyl-CoA dioxygenase family protein [Candidatus Poribacteria bacterium]
MHLTESQVSSFYKNGYLLLEDWLDEEDLQPVIEEYSAIIDERARRYYAEGRVSSLHENEPFTRRLVCLAEEAPEIADNLDIMQARGEASFNFLKNPKILDLAESFVGSEILCNPIQHIRATLPHGKIAKGPTPWHQDAGVCWPETDPFFILTIWIPIVDVTLDNGCLEVVPGSHKQGLRKHVFSPHGLDIPLGERPQIEPMPLPVRAGGILLFHNYTMHHSLLNKTDTVRWSFDLRYHDAYQPTGRPYYPAFLMRSQSRPDSLQTDYTTWCQRWEFALKFSQGAQPYRWPR